MNIDFVKSYTGRADLSGIPEDVLRRVRMLSCSPIEAGHLLDPYVLPPNDKHVLPPT